VDNFEAMQYSFELLKKGILRCRKGSGIANGLQQTNAALEDELGTETIHRPLVFFSPPPPTPPSIALLRQVATFTSMLCTFSTTLKTAASRYGRGQTATERHHSCDRPSHFCRLHWVKAACFF